MSLQARCRPVETLSDACHGVDPHRAQRGEWLVKRDRHRPRQHRSPLGGPTTRAAARRHRDETRGSPFQSDRNPRDIGKTRPCTAPGHAVSDTPHTAWRPVVQENPGLSRVWSPARVPG
jgi:hypothetical protein